MDLAQPQELTATATATATIMVDARLTPDLVGGAAFRPARLGRRGLDEEHVRAFCRQVESELVILADERRVLQDEVLRLRRRVLGQGGEDDADAPGNAHVQAVSILSRAQQTASHYVSEAQEYSRHLAQDARRRRDEMLAEAQEQADQLRAEGREHADQVRAEARLEMVQAQVAHRDRARAVTGPQRRR